MKALAAIGAVSALDPGLRRGTDPGARGPQDTRWWRRSARPRSAPANCTIILTQVTALETIRDGVAYPTTVTKAGKIVAFTVGLSRLDKNAVTAKKDVHFLDTTYGGTAQAGITVLKPVGKKEFRRWAVAAAESRLSTCSRTSARSSSSRSTRAFPSSRER